MGDATKIQWTDHTFNPWIGCTKVSAGCDHCYAEAQDRRWGHARWGKGAPRERTSETNWRKPVQWNKRAALLGQRARVFCASLADVFDTEAPVGAREDLFALIRATPHLDWQLLTKRPHNIAKMLPADWGDGYPNVWLGTTCEDQKAAELRIPVLLAVPARVRFLSVEPQIGAVNLSEWLGRAHERAAAHERRCQGQAAPLDYGRGDRWDVIYCSGCRKYLPNPFLHWVIVGGESGPGARPFDVMWARSLIEQCRAAGVAPFVKQFGAFVVDGGRTAPLDHFAPGSAPPPAGNGEFYAWRAGLKDRKGGDMAEWPEDLRVRQFPEVRR